MKLASIKGSSLSILGQANTAAHLHSHLVVGILILEGICLKIQMQFLALRKSSNLLAVHVSLPSVLSSSHIRRGNGQVEKSPVLLEHAEHAELHLHHTPFWDVLST